MESVVAVRTNLVAPASAEPITGPASQQPLVHDANTNALHRPADISGAPIFGRDQTCPMAIAGRQCVKPRAAHLAGANAHVVGPRCAILSLIKVTAHPGPHEENAPSTRQTPCPLFRGVVPPRRIGLHLCSFEHTLRGRVCLFAPASSGSGSLRYSDRSSLLFPVSSSNSTDFTMVVLLVLLLSLSIEVMLFATDFLNESIFPVGH